ncbi:MULTISPECIES: hypothetical protein [Kitasatospora]|uniref:Peptidase M50 family protein n=1 Tax=Kitasatospora setae (strain ATCC 33774 / DSM 43861 / JCM 3304 / KCC A-0304 / NBRC 14216 / KM-6054) TaxID=452652 RepID=E4NA78_KITSK|nr:MULTISPECIES: hypothetical protein [Kitasatospora]BAJ28109.1 hypothetical protein KSE_22890 [Kitasatospora setae KM-6054]
MHPSSAAGPATSTADADPAADTTGDAAGAVDTATPGVDPDRPVALHPLVYLEEGDEVTVGRVETDSYAVFPPDGAQLVRWLADGLTPRQAAEAYEREHGEGVDVADLVAGLDELGFVRAVRADEAAAAPEPAAPPVRWQRLGRAAFAPLAWAGYLLVIALAVVATVRTPDLAPRPTNIFFTPYFTVVSLVLFVGQFPLILVHEGFHALAGRRLGLPTRLRISHRLIFIVLETSLDGLVAVPRRRRYLPILAGMLADTVLTAALTLAAAVTRHADGTLSGPGRLCLALGYATLLRLAWQAFLHLRTDLYVLLGTVLGCHDLHATAQGVLRNTVRRRLGRPLLDESAWYPADRRAARWYAWLIVGGYAFSLAVFAAGVLPAMSRIVTDTVARLGGRGAGGEFLDSAVFLGLTLLQLGTVAYLSLRDRHRRRAATPATAAVPA